MDMWKRTEEEKYQRALVMNKCPVCYTNRKKYSNKCECGYMFTTRGICSCGSGKARIMYTNCCEDCINEHV